MTAVLSPFSRAQYAYAVCTTDPGSPKWFSHLPAARHHAIAPARACVGIHDGEFPPLTADIPMLRDAFEGAVLEIHQRQRRQIDAHQRRVDDRPGMVSGQRPVGRGADQAAGRRSQT